MKINLLCNSNRKAVFEILESRGFIIDDNAPVSFVERSISPPEEGIAITFNPFDLNGFIEFLDKLPKTGASKAKHIIGKKSESFEIVLFIFLQKAI